MNCCRYSCLRAWRGVYAVCENQPVHSCSLVKWPSQNRLAASLFELYVEADAGGKVCLLSRTHFRFRATHIKVEQRNPMSQVHPF